MWSGNQSLATPVLVVSADIFLLLGDWSQKLEEMPFTVEGARKDKAADPAAFAGTITGQMEMLGDPSCTAQALCGPRQAHTFQTVNSILTHPLHLVKSGVVTTWELY